MTHVLTDLRILVVLALLAMLALLVAPFSQSATSAVKQVMNQSNYHGAATFTKPDTPPDTVVNPNVQSGWAGDKWITLSWGNAGGSGNCFINLWENTWREEDRSVSGRPLDHLEAGEPCNPKVLQFLLHQLLLNLRSSPWWQTLKEVAEVAAKMF